MTGRLGPEMSMASMRRQSCDRCHGQKLRCARLEADSTGTCSRCRRQGTQCVYSFSLPKGRPSRYRSVGDAGSSLSGGGSGSGSSDDNLAEWDPGPFSSPYNTLTPTASNTSAGSDGSGASPPTPNVAGSNGANSPLWDSAANNWPGPHRINWGAVDGSEVYTGVYSSIHSQIPIDTGVPNTPEDGVLSWDTPTRRNTESDGRLSADSSGSGSISLDRNIVPPVSNERTAPGDIVKLSQLSSHLHSLLGTSCLLAETEGATPPTGGLILNDAAFKPVAAWLAQVSTDRPLAETQAPAPAEVSGLGGVMHDAFTASHQLLEVLHCQRVHLDSIQAYYTASQRPTGAYGVVMTDQVARGYINSQFSSSIVRHLVITCHRLLLNVYTIVLIALQVDADLLLAPNEPLPTLTHTAPDHSPPPPLADIRIVSVVHLCSYLVERQRIAVEIFLSPVDGPILPQPTSRHARDATRRTPDGSYPGPRPAPSLLESTCQGDHMMTQLEMEVHRRLSRLRLALRI